jgi:hypothetical protein
MFSLSAPPGMGKSASGAGSGSVWGGGDELFIESWNHTANNLELVAAAHHATFLVLDETRLSDQGQARSSVAALFAAVMRLAEGRTKGRLTEAGTVPRSRTPTLSTANKPLDELALEGRVQIDDAYRDRLPDVPLPGMGMGAFENLHGFRDHHAFAAELIRLTREAYGVASEEFIDKFVAARARDDREVRAYLLDQSARYLRLATRRVSSPGRDLGRLHRRFATIFASARLAIRFGILPWTAEELAEALIACELAHAAHVRQASRAAASAARDANPLERLRAHVRDEAQGFVDLRRRLVRPTADHDHASCPGYVNQRPDGTLEYLFSETKFNEICGGKGPALRLKTDLKRKGALLTDGNRPSTRRMIWASGDARREQVMAVRASFFGGPTTSGSRTTHLAPRGRVGQPAPRRGADPGLNQTLSQRGISRRRRRG